MPAGRPSMYTPELARRICRAIAISTDSIKKICQRNDDFPCSDTVNEWRFDYPEFSEQYTLAKRQQAELLAEEIITISDDDYDDLVQGEHGMIPNAARVNRHRLRVDSRKWVACKLLPKVYGDKSEVKSDVTVNVHEDMLKELE